MQHDMTGVNVIVTGGGRGIGRAMALAFAEAGARIAVMARTLTEISDTANLVNEASPGRAFAIRCDVTSATQVRNAVTEAERRLGEIHVLINNAGIIGPIKPFVETTPKEWWDVMSVNLYGPVELSHAVLPGMIARKRGCIINVVSGAAPFAYFSAYATAKSALIRFSECLAAELRHSNISVFPMGPGTVRTAMSEHSVNSPEGQKWIPWFRRIFDDGLDLPIERPVDLALGLASGRFDALSGMNVTPFDDLDNMLAHLDVIARDKLYSMRVRTFETEEWRRVASVREQGTKG